MTHLQLYQYGVLAHAYVRISGAAPPDLEERVTNLLNHLLWDSYHPGEDPINDEIVKAALRRLFQSADSIDLDQCLELRVESLDMEGEEHEQI